jgi:hypothetical protein
MAAVRSTAANYFGSSSNAENERNHSSRREVHPELEGVAVCRLAPTQENFLWHTWWHFITQFFTQFLAVMGFTASEPTTHEQLHRGRAHTLFTIVARRE